MFVSEPPEPTPLEPQPRKLGLKLEDRWDYDWLEESPRSQPEPYPIEEVFCQTGEPDPEAPQRHPAFLLLKRLVREEKIMRRWGIAITAAAAVLAFSPFFPTNNAVARAAASPRPSAEPESDPPLDLTPCQEVVGRFLAASGLEEKYALVRSGAGLLERMREYYFHHPDEPAEFVLQSAVPDHPGLGFVLLRGVDGMEKPLDILLEKTSAGYRIDWRFLTGSGDMEWAQWLKTRPQSPVLMRAEAFAGSYYAPPFTDPEKYLSLRLTDYHDQHTVWAYVDRASKTGVDLEQSLKSTPRLRITAELTFPPQTTAMQPGLLLRAVLPDGWKDRTLTVFEK